MRWLIVVWLLLACRLAAADSRCHTWPYLDFGLAPAASSADRALMFHNAGGVRFGTGCDHEHPAVFRAGLFIASSIGEFTRADTTGLELESTLGVGRVLTGLRVSLAEGKAAPVVTIGPRVRYSYFFAGADLIYLDSGSSEHPKAFAGSVIIGVQGVFAIAGPVVTLALLLEDANSR